MSGREVMKRICVYVGSRANYSSCKPIMRAIQGNPDLELMIMLGAPALLERFGKLEDILATDGFAPSAKFYMVVEGETPVTMAKSVGLGVIESSTILNNLNPDLLLVVGDRFDVMAPVLAAAYMNIPIAHTMGGEITGTIDESTRHAITKFSHIHFPATEEARNRIVKLGENPDHVFNVGCPRLDLVKEAITNANDSTITLSDALNTIGVGATFDLDQSSFILVSQHPVTTEYGSNRVQIESTLEVLNRFQMPTVMIWPNVDAGSDEVSKGIRTFREYFQPNWLHLFTNLPVEQYFMLMDRCACLIGNSSSAIREGAFLGTPAVNIGTRQTGRTRGRNVVDVQPIVDEIESAIGKQLKHGRYESDDLYGDGSASQRIVKIIADLSYISVQKRITY